MSMEGGVPQTKKVDFEGVLNDRVEFHSSLGEVKVGLSKMLAQLKVNGAPALAAQVEQIQASLSELEALDAKLFVRAQPGEAYIKDGMKFGLDASAKWE